MFYNSEGRNTRWDTLGPTTPPGSKEALISPSATRTGTTAPRAAPSIGAGGRTGGRAPAREEGPVMLRQRAR